MWSHVDVGTVGTVGTPIGTLRDNEHENSILDEHELIGVIVVEGWLLTPRRKYANLPHWRDSNSLALSARLRGLTGMHVGFQKDILNVIQFSVDFDKIESILKHRTT